MAGDDLLRLSLAVTQTAMKCYFVHGAFKTQATYQRQVWRTMREYYAGEIDAFGFIDDLVEYIDNQFNRAWREGARDMNVDPRTFTDDDLALIERRIRGEQNYVLTLAADLDTARANGSGVERFRVRSEMWARRYSEVVDAARAHFGGRQLLEWVLGPTEQHCQDGENHGAGYGCAQLSGTVATAADWERAKAKGIYPQSPYLSCQGFRCGCRLTPTKKKPTGAIPGA
jgi:hypothetical protein